MMYRPLIVMSSTASGTTAQMTQNKNKNNNNYRLALNNC